MVLSERVGHRQHKVANVRGAGLDHQCVARLCCIQRGLQIVAAPNRHRCAFRVEGGDGHSDEEESALKPEPYHLLVVRGSVTIRQAQHYSTTQGPVPFIS